MSMIMHVSCALTLGFSADCANFEPKLFDIVDEFPKSEHLTNRTRMAGRVRGVTAAALRGQRRCFSSNQRVIDPTRWVKGSGSNKLAGSPDEAIADIFPGATLCVGGFGLCGSARAAPPAHTAMQPTFESACAHTDLSFSPCAPQSQRISSPRWCARAPVN